MIPTVLCAPSNPRSPDQESLSERIPHIAAALKGAKVTCVQIKYDGRFDCGDVQDPVYLTSDGTPMNAGVSKGLQSEQRVDPRGQGSFVPPLWSQRDRLTPQRHQHLDAPRDI